MTHAEAILAVASILLCGLAAALSIWRMVQGGRRADAGALLMMGASAVVVAVILVARAVRAVRFPAFGYFEALLFYGLTVLAAHLYVSLRHRMRGLSLILAPYATAVLAIALTGVRQPIPAAPEAGRVWIALHICSAFLAYALCTTAGVLGVAYLVQDSNLKRKRLGATFRILPALEALDHRMARHIGAAFLMLSLAVGFGVRLVQMRGGGMEWATDPKIVATAVTWGVYAILIHMRGGGRRHGRGMALLTLLGLLFLLFSFLGIHLLAESAHDFILVSKVGGS